MSADLEDGELPEDGETSDQDDSSTVKPPPVPPMLMHPSGVFIARKTALFPSLL